ncbi:MAG: JAB domain-containing protein [Saccharofermentanales bacterium]
MRLYEYFNCENGDELFSLMENNSPEVQDLLQFYEAVEQNRFFRNTEELNRTRRVKEFVEKEGCLPVNNQMLLCLLDTKLQIVCYKQFFIDSNCPEKVIRDVSQYVIDLDYNNILMLFPSEDYYNNVAEYVADELTKNFSVMDAQLCDVILASKARNKFVTIKDSESRPCTINESAWSKSSELDLLEKNYILTSESLSEAQLSLKEAKDYKEFTDYFVKRAIIGLDAIKDEIKIQNLVKILLHDDTVESFYRIDYDSDYKVKNLELISTGSHSNVTTNNRTLLRGINLHSNSMFAVAHNHPSGSVEPSEQDISTSLKIEKMARILDIKYLDHYIVAYGGTLKLSEQNSHLAQAKKAVIDDYFEHREKNMNIYQTTLDDYDLGYF